MHLDWGEPCQIAFQKGFTILTPGKQQPGFIEWLLGARPIPGPRDTGEKQPRSCCLHDSQSSSLRPASGAASELKGRRSFPRNQKRRGEARGYYRWWRRSGTSQVALEPAGSGDILYQSRDPVCGLPIGVGYIGVLLRSKIIVPPLRGFIWADFTGRQRAHRLVFDQLITTARGDKPQNGSTRRA